MQVIQHIAQPHEFLSERRRVLKPGEALHRTNHRLDAAPKTWLDRAPARIMLAAVLRLAEHSVRERDCPVVRLEKC